MLSEGEYSATILRGYLGFDNFGNEAACFELGIRDGAGAAHKITWAGGFNGEWLERTVRSLRAAGWTGDDLETIAALKGKQIGVTIKHKTSKKGQIYLQVFLNPRKTMDPAESRAFADRMKRAVAAANAPETEDEEEHRATDGAGRSREPMPPVDDEERAAARAMAADDDECPF